MKILLHEEFERNFRSLSRKYPSLEYDVDDLISSLENNPSQGESLGKNCFKIRLNIKSKGKGKRGGGRVVTCFKVSDDVLWLLTLYDKSNIENISDAFLDDLIKKINT
jgi:hypothetical protein